MSRYKATCNLSCNVAYGFDHALGYFLDIFDPKDDEQFLVEENSLFTGMNNGKFLDLIEEHGVSVVQEHKDLIMCDLPF